VGLKLFKFKFNSYNYLQSLSTSIHFFLAIALILCQFVWQMIRGQVVFEFVFEISGSLHRLLVLDETLLLVTDNFGHDDLPLEMVRHLILELSRL
jgi:hypothetical protein